jgi:hypothetical protein
MQAKMQDALNKMIKYESLVGDYNPETGEYVIVRPENSYGFPIIEEIETALKGMDYSIRYHPVSGIITVKELKDEKLEPAPEWFNNPYRYMI